MRFEYLQGLNLSSKKNENCHIIVCGNEKGGSGKSTLAMHIAVSLVLGGFRVATVDLDTRQQSVTRYVNYRHKRIGDSEPDLPVPDHYWLHHEAALLYEISTDETAHAFSAVLMTMRPKYDFIVIDTPGSHTMLSTAAHRQADSLLTPINDSFVDFDVLANIDPDSFEIQSIAQYASAVRQARQQKQIVNHSILDWVVVRNRMSPISSRNERKVDTCLKGLAMRLGFRIADGITERVIYRENFARGLTAIDELKSESDRPSLSMSNVAARNEVRNLIKALRLPIDQQSIARTEARSNWLSSQRKRIKIPNIFAD